MMELLRRLHFYLRRRQFEEELDEEMRHHLAMTCQKQFGNVTLLKEQSRAMWTWTFWEQFTQDLRYALRTMKANLAFTALAVLSLALGIGANTAIYSFMDSILLRALPVGDPESLVRMTWHAGYSETHGMSRHDSDYSDPKTGFTGGVFSYPAFEFFRQNDSLFSGVFAYQNTGKLTVTVEGQADLSAGEYVSGDYFRSLGTPPASGRLIGAEDDRPGATPVVAISFALSQKRFGGAASAAGQSILVNNVPFTVVGVTPPEFFGTDPGTAPEMYLPLHANLLLEADTYSPVGPRYLDPSFNWLEIMARLRPGIGMAQAQAVMAPPFRQMMETMVANNRRWRQRPTLAIKEGAGGIDGLRRRYSKPLYLLMTLVGLILAIACANVANLLLARAAARRREMALRLSVGAGRLRVVRQLLTESVLLASLGGALGILFAIWGIRVLTLLLANGQANFTLHATLNWHVLGVAAALSFLTGVLFGLAPAMQAARVDVIPALKETRTNRARSRFPVSLSQALVVSQIALTLLILAAAGLFVRTLRNLDSIDLGFNRENLLTFQLDARQAGHKDPEIYTFYAELQKRFRAIPGVRSVSLSDEPLIANRSSATIVTASGAPARYNPSVLTVGPGFFTTMQIALLRGREIDEHDRASLNPVAVVNQAFAKAAFGDQSPLGQHLNLPLDPVSNREIEIVGVSTNAHYRALQGDVRPTVYLPFDLAPWGPVKEMVYELRTAGNPLAYADTVRQIVREADRRVPLSEVKTQTAWIDQTINQEIVFAKLCSAFAILALVIACVGLYGTISYNVARRTNEIGIRMALGAQRGGLIRMILRQVVVLAALGFAIGLPTVLATSKLVASFLYGTKPNDPLTLALAVATLLFAALLAGYAPARRASRIDPMTALRNE